MQEKLLLHFLWARLLQVGLLVLTEDTGGLAVTQPQLFQRGSNILELIQMVGGFVLGWCL